MTCESCGDKPKKCNKDFPKAVIEIDNSEQITLMRKVTIPASMGDDTTVPPAVGKYKNVLLYYEANQKSYLYSSDGIPTQLVNGVTDYEAAVNLPKINGYTLLGNKTATQLGLQDKLTAGENISIDNNNVISAVDTTYGPATDTEIGLVKPGDGLSVDTDGTLGVNVGDGLKVNTENDVFVVKHVFDTVADMKASTDLANGDYAQTLGFHAVNDNGGAIYKISDTGTANEMDVIAVSNLYANLVGDNILSPEQFGAYGDGAHDDAPNIRMALAYIDSKNGGNLQLNNKTYLLNSLDNPNETVTRFFVIPDNLIMNGNGTLKIADNFGDYDCVFVYGYALNKIIFRDFTIDDNTTNNPVLNTTGGTEGHHRTGFRLIAYPTKDIVIDNITFNDCAGVWQIIMEKVIRSNVSNIVINYSTDQNINYDRTSIYFGALYGEVSGCTLNGNGKGGTAFELHGNDDILYDNYVNDYGTGVFVTNQNVVEEDIDRLEVCSNTFIVKRRGIQCWLDKDNKNIGLINIHDNMVDVTDTTSTSDILGIGNYNIVGDGSGVRDYIVYANTIKTNNNYAIPLRFQYDQSVNTFTINNLVINNNVISGVMQQGVRFESQANNTLKILTTVIDHNKFTVSNATRLIHFVAKQGFDYMYITNNIVESSSLQQFYRIFGTPNCQSFIENNKLNFSIEAYLLAGGDDTTGIKLIHDGDVLLNHNTVFDSLAAISTIKNGSVIKTGKYTCRKEDGKWIVDCSSQVMPTHQWFGKGSVINLTNDSNIMAIAKKAGYLADHKMDTGDHHVGDWVQYGYYVWYCKADNNYTDNPESHTDSFQYIGDLCTFYTISAS